MPTTYLAYFYPCGNPQKACLLGFFYKPILLVFQFPSIRADLLDFTSQYPKANFYINIKKTDFLDFEGYASSTIESDQIHFEKYRSWVQNTFDPKMAKSRVYLF